MRTTKTERLPTPRFLMGSLNLERNALLDRWMPEIASHPREPWFLLDKTIKANKKYPSGILCYLLWWGQIRQVLTIYREEIRARISAYAQ